LFEPESLPLGVAVVFDISRSMGDATIAGLSSAALYQVVARLLPEDRMAIVAFAERPFVVAPWSKAQDILRLQVTLEANGGTSLNDAVAASFNLIEDAPRSKPVVLVISDGGENSSRTTLAQLVATRRQSETLVYAFNMAARSTALQPGPATFEGARLPSPERRTDVEILPRVIAESGGVGYRLLSEADTETMARAFVDDLRSQYTIGYMPSKPFDGKYRRVKVEINKRGYRVRHRGGYLAQPASQP
jgi:VWFA-related protein